MNGTSRFRRACESHGNCVEVARLELVTILDSVEVNRIELIAIRDSKEPEGSMQLYTREEWEAFRSGVKAGVFDDI